MRSVTHSDSDDVLSGRHDPPTPLSILENRHPSSGSETWHTFVVRRSPDQEAVESYVAMLEAQVADCRDAINMADPEDMDEGAWRLLDRLESVHVALGFAARELRDLL